MRKTIAKYLIVTSALVACAATLAHESSAQPKDREEKREERKDKREERREERQDKRDDRHDKREAHKEEIKDEWKEKRKAWREKREERRKDLRDEARKKWGDLVDRPAVREELRDSARRMARLERVRFLAEASGKKDLLDRATKALEKERARHDTKMAQLKTEGAK